MTPNNFQRLSAALSPLYTLERELGRGGMATVYLARDLRQNREVALKILHPELASSTTAARFAREIASAATIQHPNVIAPYDSGMANGLPYYTMAYVDGETLRETMRRKTQLSASEVVRVASEIAHALSCAHRAGIVHRDVKPENILLSKDRVFVADFGVAWNFEELGNDLTSVGVAVGSPKYMSPEQAGGVRNLDGRADLYSLACVTYEMLVGHPPYQGDNAMEIIARHALDPLPPIASARPNVPLHIRAAIERALAKAPADRFESVDAFREALNTDTIDEILVGIKNAPPRKTRSWLRRTGFAVIALAVSIAGWRATHVASASAPPSDRQAIAVLPFRISGDTSLNYLREGLTELLSMRLGAEDDIHPADIQMVLKQWDRFSTVSKNEQEKARSFAISRGIGKYVVGNLIASGKNIHVKATLFDTHDHSRAEATVEGVIDSLFPLLDRLTLQLLALNVGEPSRRLSSLTSTSMPAVRSYLAGRAALRSGETDFAIREFSSALEKDSTFALAALGMAATGAWSQQSSQSQALRRGLNTGYELRSRLPRRDQLLFEAYVLPSIPGLQTAARQLSGWRHAAEAYAESSEAQYEFGDRLYHSGTQLAIDNAIELAQYRFQAAVRLDSGQASATAHLIEIASRKNDVNKVKSLLQLYRRIGSTADAADFVFWRSSLALDDQVFLNKFRNRVQDISQSSLNRIIGFGQIDDVGLSDVNLGASELRRRIESHTATGSRVHPAQTLHAWALNHGSEADAVVAIENLRSSEPIPTGASIVYFTSDQVPILDALFWDGDRSSASSAVERIERRLPSVVPLESEARTLFFSNACLVVLWDLANHNTVRIAPLIRQLRTGAHQADSSTIHGGNPILCLSMIDAMYPDTVDRTTLHVQVAKLDSIMLDAPYQFGVDFGNLVLADVLERRGEYDKALAVIRRRAYDWDTGPLYLTSYLRAEARLASRTGDYSGAIFAYKHFLALREGADAHFKPINDVVRGELKKIESRNGGRVPH